jgi:2-desacetyl-2-hydroxyethyl bacteriochlorophyllide A dehydrogenase
VRRVGICGTDIHAFGGTQPFFSYPRILGHELAVEVLAIGPSVEQDLSVGDACCVRPYLNCGHCGACRRGVENCCVNMQVLGVHRDGGMREVINVPSDKLHKSTTLKPEELAIVEMLSIGCHATQRANIIPGDVALVVGAGPIGLGVAQFAHLAGAQVLAMDVNKERLTFAQEQAGIDHCIDARQDVMEQIKAITPDDLPTVVFDATGSAQAMMKSFDFVAHGGRLIFVGLFQGDVTFHDPEFHKREMSLFASRNATRGDFDRVISALETRCIAVESWITHHFSAEQLVSGLGMLIEPDSGVVKAVLEL